MQAMQVFHNMEDTIKEIITASIDDAKCSFEGDSCNLKVVVTSSTFSGIIAKLLSDLTISRGLEQKVRFFPLYIPKMRHHP